MERKDIVRLGLDVYHGTVQTEFTNGENPEEKLRAALIEANGGSDKISAKTLRSKGGELFAIVEEIINVVVEEGLKGDEFFNDFVDYRNVAEGDKNEFLIPSNSTFIVSDMANGIATPRRQRIGEDRVVTVPTIVKGVRVYEELRRLLAGKTNWTTFIDKVSVAVMKRRLDDIYTAFSGISATTPGLDATYVTAGSYSEEAVLAIVDHVEAATGKKAMIIGTKPALRKLTTAVMSHEAESSYHNVGFIGKLAGVDMLGIMNRHKAGTNNFILPDNKIWIVASDDQFIKFVTEGEAFIKETTDNADMSQEYTYIEQTGCAIALARKMGVYTITG